MIPTAPQPTSPLAPTSPENLAGTAQAFSADLASEGLAFALVSQAQPLLSLAKPLLLYVLPSLMLGLHVLVRLGRLGWLPSPAPAYALLAAFCARSGVSAYEVGGLLTSALGLVALDIFLATAEDDLVDAASLAIFGLVWAALGLAALGAGAGAYYAWAASSRGASPLRRAAQDLVGVLAGAFRILVCWARYLAYDLSGELLDLTSHHSYEARALGPGPWAPLLSAQADLAFVGLQIAATAAKLFLASALLWLLLDLLLLRPLGAVAAAWALWRERRA